MKIKAGLKTFIIITLSYLVIAVAVDNSHIFLLRPLAWASELEQLAQAEEPHADSSHSTPSEHGAEAGGHAEHGGGHGKFFGYEVAFSLISCIYFALVLKIWPAMFGKHEEEHH